MKLRTSVAVVTVATALSLPAAALAQETVPGTTADPSAGATPATPAAPVAGAPQQAAAPPGQAPPAEPARAKVKLKLEGLKRGEATIGGRVEAVGTVTPFVPGQRVVVKLGNRGETVLEKNPFVRQVKGKKYGRFHLRSKALTEIGKYRVRVTKKATSRQQGFRAKSRQFGLRIPDVDPGESGPAVEIFNALLRRQGYFNTDKASYGSHTERAVMAFRKVNGMARNFQATPEIFEMLAAGKGGFKAEYPNSGKHVEVDISRQVMALVDDGEVKYVFHVATGAAATPSDVGGFTFYRKDPGFNSIGMYYSIYYNGGEATHGYQSVPPYPASHGCIRNPIPDSVFIYDWIDLGDKMFVYV